MQTNELLAEAAAYESNSASEKYNYWLEMNRPFNIIKPRIFMDGDKWCALYGDEMQSGVAAFGSTPEEASRNFDKVWSGGR